MPRRFDGQVAVVTGAAHGMGRVHAARLASEGASLVLGDLDYKAAKAVADGLGNAIAIRADVTKAVDCAQLAQAAVNRFSRVDILINNAGGSLIPQIPFDSVTDQQWEDVFAFNLRSQWLCAKAVVGDMRRLGRGKIVNIASTIIFDGSDVGLLPYAAAKGGVMGFTRALARELGPDNITVNAVAPGGIGGDPAIKPFTAEELEEMARWRMQQQTIKTRKVSADDVAAAVAFFASHESDLITGQLLVVDGGAMYH